MKLSSQAVELNVQIKKDNPSIYQLLSKKGKAIYFPKDGILSQTKQAKQTKLNATIGAAFEEDETPMRLGSISKKVKIEPKDVFPYAPSFGKPELRTLWQKEIFRKNPSLKGVISTPIVTSGLTHGLSIIAYLFLNNNDKIIISDKYWGNYKLIFELGFGAKLDTFNTFAKNKFDVQGFENKLKSSKAKKLVILFNFPNNPSGYTPLKKEAEKLFLVIKKFAKKGKKILVIVDDAYFGLVYKKNVLRQSLFSFLANTHKNVLAVKLDAATKEEYVWGFRVGFITFGAKGISKQTCTCLENKTAGVVRGNISNAPHVSQSLILKSITSKIHEKEKKQKYNLLKKRFQLVEKQLKNEAYEKYFQALPYNSGYFMCIKLNKKINAEKVRLSLIKDYNTGVISSQNLIRIAYSSVPSKNIPSLFNNIYLACKKQIQ